jgi:hypothetical protein
MRRLHDAAAARAAALPLCHSSKQLVHLRNSPCQLLLQQLLALNLLLPYM